MMRVKILGIVAFLLVLTGLSGWRVQPTWIELWRGAAYPEAFYIVGRMTVPSHTVGPLYGILNTDNHGGPSLSNRLPVGTRVYRIHGASPARKLAVEIHPGDFVEADYSGTQRPW